jgi:hypothetical protein
MAQFTYEFNSTSEFRFSSKFVLTKRVYEIPRVEFINHHEKGDEYDMNKLKNPRFEFNGAMLSTADFNVAMGRSTTTKWKDSIVVDWVDETLPRSTFDTWFKVYMLGQTHSEIQTSAKRKPPKNADTRPSKRSKPLVAAAKKVIAVTVASVPMNSRFFDIGGVSSVRTLKLSHFVRETCEGVASIVGVKAERPVMSVIELVKFYHSVSHGDALEALTPLASVVTDRFEFICEDPLRDLKIYEFCTYCGQNKQSSAVYYAWSVRHQEFLRFDGFTGDGTHVGFDRVTAASSPHFLASRQALDRYLAYANEHANSWREGWTAAANGAREKAKASPSTPARVVREAGEAWEDANWLTNMQNTLSTGFRHMPKPVDSEIKRCVWDQFVKASAIAGPMSANFSAMAIIQALALGAEGPTPVQKKEIAECMMYFMVASTNISS